MQHEKNPKLEYDKMLQRYRANFYRANEGKDMHALIHVLISDICDLNLKFNIFMASQVEEKDETENKIS